MSLKSSSVPAHLCPFLIQQSKNASFAAHALSGYKGNKIICVDCRKVPQTGVAETQEIMVSWVLRPEVGDHGVAGWAPSAGCEGALLPSSHLASAGLPVVFGITWPGETALSSPFWSSCGTVLCAFTPPSLMHVCVLV